MKRLRDRDDLERMRQEALSKRPERFISLGMGTASRAHGAEAVYETLKDEVTRRGMDVPVKATGDHGLCGYAPVMVIYPEGLLYHSAKPSDVSDILDALERDEVVDRLLYANPLTKETFTYEKDIPFYKKQMRLVMGLMESVESLSVEDYLCYGGFSALAKAMLDMEPQAIIQEVISSGLRGRGGAGFRTGWKWEDAANRSSPIKYIICNGDEGDPGAYMDRCLLEGLPFEVLEGMIIGAYAIGAHEGFVYVRKEYPLATHNVQEAIGVLKELCLLGNDILGSGFDFDIQVVRGGGAFVCGESSALIASVEGRVGEPRSKHVHATESGLWGRPTVLNNVETLANVPFIVDRGGEWFASIGTKESKGTKVFSLAGDIYNTGLVEVPMGITLREVVYDIGGGIQGGNAFKAVQTGGPSGGCLPDSQLGLPVDFDTLDAAGSMMGSGGMIIMDENTCMVDVARYFVKFLTEESCGKCVPCREGLKHMLEILNRITQGEGTMEDVDLLDELGYVVAHASLCGLGKSAPNPVLSTLRYFRDEYVEHVRDKKCRAGVCKALVRYEIDAQACTGCRVCFKACPVDAISGEPEEVHVIDQGKCIKCGICKDVCKFDAVKVV